MGLKVIGFAAHNLDKAIMLRANLDAGLVEVYQLLAALKMLAEGTAAMELIILVEHARNERRVGTRLAQAHVGMLAHRNAGIRHERPATLGLGHIGHKSRRAHRALIDTAGNPQVNGIRITDIIGTNEQLLHIDPHLRKGTLEAQPSAPDNCPTERML